MSSSSPEDQDCVVAVKFLGPQLSLPKLTKTKRELLYSCCASQHNPQARLSWLGGTGRPKLTARGMEKMKTKAMMVFRLDGEGNAVYTQDIGDLRIFISNSEPFCVPASSFPGMDPNVRRRFLGCRRNRKFPSHWFLCQYWKCMEHSRALTRFHPKR